VLYDERANPIPTAEYFIGSIVVCRDSQANFELIDGQQRLTTSYLILCALRDALVAVGSTVPGNLLDMIADESTDPMTGLGKYRHRLILKYEDSAGILENIANRDAIPDDTDGATLSVRNICAAYEAAREFLAVRFMNDPTKLLPFFAAFTLRVKLIRILTPDVNHALKVFETINDRGVSLNAMDLLKNLLFMRTPSANYETPKERWRMVVDAIDNAREKPLRFLRYYLLAFHDVDLNRGIREDEIYSWFANNAKSVGIQDQPLAFVDRLVQASKAYGHFVSGQDATGTPNRHLMAIRAFSGSSRNHLILLLAGKHLPTPLFHQLARHVENLVFCYVLTREQSKVYERNFARWARELVSVTDAAGFGAWADKYIRSELAGHERQFDYWLREMTTNSIQQYRLRYILAKLTQYVDTMAWDNEKPLTHYLSASVHVEHILPSYPSAIVRETFDKADDYHLYTPRLGNLTLLEKTINTSISNGIFAAKKPSYRQSTFLLTKALAEKPQVGVATQLNKAVADLEPFDSWTSASIETRQAQLLLLARRVWGIDEATGHPIAEAVSA